MTLVKFLVSVSWTMPYLVLSNPNWIRIKQLWINGFGVGLFYWPLFLNWFSDQQDDKRWIIEQSVNVGISNVWKTRMQRELRYSFLLVNLELSWRKNWHIKMLLMFSIRMVKGLWRLVLASAVEISWAVQKQCFNSIMSRCCVGCFQYGGTSWVP